MSSASGEAAVIRKSSTAPSAPSAPYSGTRKIAQPGSPSNSSWTAAAVRAGGRVSAAVTAGCRRAT